MKIPSEHTRKTFVMHKAVQQSEQVMQLLKMIMRFHYAVTESPGVVFAEISQ